MKPARLIWPTIQRIYHVPISPVAHTRSNRSRPTCHNNFRNSRHLCRRSSSSCRITAYDVSSTTCLPTLVSCTRSVTHMLSLFTVAHDSGTLLYFGRVIYFYLFIFFRPANFLRPWAHFGQNLPHHAVCPEIVYLL